jgi:hypothetical protein
MPGMIHEDRRDTLSCELLAAVKTQLPKLRELYAEVSDRNYEDPIYRFYHGSFKVYGLQLATGEIVWALHELLPGIPLNEMFMTIIREGTGKKFNRSHNRRWQEETRPILEAFFHARFFLEMAIRYGEELEEVPQGLPNMTEAPPIGWEGLPSGWAAFLYLYDLR